MKTKLITIIFALCMILGTTAMAVEYTVADILGVSGTMAMSVSSVSLQKVVEGDQKTAKVTPYDEMAQLWRGLLDLPVTFFDKPLEESKERKIINFSISSEVANAQYTYDNYWGFSYNDGEKTLVLRYLVSEESLDELINGLTLQWENTDVEKSVVTTFTVGKNTFQTRYSEISIDEENAEVVPFIDEKNSRTMLPLRAVNWGIGGGIAWDEEQQSVTILTNLGLHITMKIDCDEINLKQYNIVQGTSVTVTDEILWEKTLKTDCKPCIVNDRTFVPLRIVSELFNYDVEWNEEKKEIYLSQKQEHGFSVFPIGAFTDTDAYVGLTCYNTSYMPVELTFGTPREWGWFIYDERGKKITEQEYVTSGGPAVCYFDGVLFGIPKEWRNSIGNEISKLKKGTYYSDCYLYSCYSDTISESFDNVLYRVFFEVE